MPRPFANIVVGMACALLGLADASFAAEAPAHTRIFRHDGGYAPGVTFSPLGNVLLRNAESQSVSIFDGFTRKGVAVPEENHFRVFQSRSGQLWSIASEGLLLHHNGQWTLHPIPEIRAELQRSPIRQLRQIGLLPAEVNHALILLSDRLLEFDADSRRVGLIRRASDTGLEQFYEMTEGEDGSIWISGKAGVITSPGPVRKLTAASQWTEFLLPTDTPVESLARPHFSPPHTMTTVGTSSDNQRYVVRLVNGEWNIFGIEQEKVRQAWADWDDVVWGYSYNALLRFESPNRPRKEPVAGAQYDMVLETGSAFWISSSEGLVRYAPPLWRIKPPLNEVQGLVQSIHFEDQGGTDVWLATSDGLVQFSGERLQIHRWPEEVETLVNPSARIYQLSNEQLLVSTESQLYNFDRASHAFARLNPPGQTMRVIGRFNDGALCAWFDSATNRLDLRRYDGRQFTPIQVPPVEWQFEELASFLQSANGALWIGGDNGLLHVRPNGEAAEVHSGDTGLPSDQIGVIAEIGDGKIWCGTSARIYEYQAGRWNLVYHTGERVTEILRDGDSIWVSTASGVFRQFQNAWIRYGVNEGLPPGIVYTLALDPAENLWAGTSRGVVRFHPNADRDAPRALPALVGDRAVSAQEPTVIQFRGQDKWDYTLPGDLLFSHRLDEGTWTPFTNVAQRVFANLSSGNHVLEVAVMDKNGNKSPRPSSIEFSVIVPWFRDPRLVVVSILLGCVALILAALAVNKHLELKRSYARVEHIVTQRTGELQRANEELLHSQKMRAIGTMAAGIAHDFNNILSIIKGSAQIIESHPDDKDKIKTRVNRIQTVVEQGASIVQALLGLGRMNEKEMAPCDLGQLLREIKKLLADRFPDSVQILIEVDPSLRPVICSREAIEQMLLNFILNGVDAMNNDGVLHLYARRLDLLPGELVVEPAPAPHYAMVSVEDHGTGIPADILPRIFEPFFTTKSFSSRRGTGLGLSMVYELAKGMGYGLKVESRPGRGSTFSIILPGLSGD